MVPRVGHVLVGVELAGPVDQGDPRWGGEVGQHRARVLANRVGVSWCRGRQVVMARGRNRSVLVDGLLQRRGLEGHEAGLGGGGAGRRGRRGWRHGSGVGVVGQGMGMVLVRLVDSDRRLLYVGRLDVLGAVRVVHNWTQQLDVL